MRSNRRLTRYIDNRYRSTTCQRYRTVVIEPHVMKSSDEKLGKGFENKYSYLAGKVSILK